MDEAIQNDGIVDDPALLILARLRLNDFSTIAAFVVIPTCKTL